MPEDLINQAIALARAGRKSEARGLLMRILSTNPQSELAWLWLADCAANQPERIQVLETCLRMNPQAHKARASLNALRQSSPPSPQPKAEEPPPASPPAPSPAPETVENEWPAIREQAKALPWYEDRAEVPAPDPSLLHRQQAEPAPEEPVSAFTIDPEGIPPDEFSRIESQTEAALLRKPQIRPLKIQQERARKKEEARKRRKKSQKSQFTPARLAVLIVLLLLGIVGIVLFIAGLLAQLGAG
jgi:hypothetical protein